MLGMIEVNLRLLHSYGLNLADQSRLGHSNYEQSPRSFVMAYLCKYMLLFSFRSEDYELKCSASC